MRGQTTTADLALARDAGADGLAVLVGDADVEGRHGKAEVAAAGQEGKLDAHHGEAAEFDHAVAVEEYGRNAPATGQAWQRAERAQAVADFSGQVIAGREPARGRWRAARGQDCC